jgi:hypothetical protein
MRLNPRTGLLLRIVCFTLLCILLYLQWYFYWQVRWPDVTLFDDIPLENYTADDFNRTFPWESGTYDTSLLETATSYLHLPAWSPSHIACEAHPELSCFEMIRAYEKVESYMRLYSTNALVGCVKVSVSSSMALHCRLSSFYNGFLVAMFTKRRLVLSTDEFAPLWLRPEHRGVFAPPSDLPRRTHKIAHNYTFPCEELMVRARVIELSGCMWPQVAYIHSDLAPLMRAAFGFHAAYYVANFLFEVSGASCNSLGGIATVAVTHKGREWSLSKKDFAARAAECGDGANMTYIEEDENGEDRDNLCKMKQIIAAEKIVFTFGAVLPWFAMAMQGRRGAAVDLDGKRCIELRNSQSGSIIHTYNPRKFFHYSTNNDFLVCGPNFNDARLFMRYLMW